MDKNNRSMDYIDFPRKLVYRERSSLEDFAEEHEENTLFIDNMLDSYYFSSANGKERALRCFNTAYYLCTIILQCETHPEWNFAKYCDIAFCGDNGNKVYQSFTLSLVYIFLTHAYYEVPCKKLLKKFESFFVTFGNTLITNDPFLDDYTYQDVCNDLLKDAPEHLLIGEEFSPRKIDRDIFKDVDGPGDQWSRKTNYYDRQEIRKIVDFLGKDEEEKHVLIKLIDRDAQRFYSSNSAPYIQDVKPMLEDMDECIYHEYNDSDIQAIAEAEIEELKYQDDVRPLLEKIAKLEKDLACFKEQQPDEYVTDDEVKGAWEQAFSNAKGLSQQPVKETDNSLQQQLAEAQKKIEELNLAIQGYKEQGKGLSAPEAAIFLTTICLELNQIPSNGREALAPIIEYCWGKSNSTAAEALRRKVTEQSANKLADYFVDTTPKLARLIRELPQKLEEIKNKRLLMINPKC